MEPWDLSGTAETGSKPPPPFKNSPAAAAQLPVKCLICVKEIPPRPGGVQILPEEESTVILLFPLFKLFKLSPLVFRYLLKESSFSNVTLVYCAACKETISHCLKISQEIENLRNLLEGLTCKIKEDFMEGYYCRPDANCETTNKIRKTLVQCWTTSTVKIQKLPPSNNSKNNTFLNDELKLRPSSPVEQNTKNEDSADASTTGNKCLSNVVVSDSNPTTIRVDPDNSDGDEFIDASTPRSPSPVISDLISESDKNEFNNIVSGTFQSKDLFVSSTEAGSTEESNTEPKLTQLLVPKKELDVNPSLMNAESNAEINAEMIRQTADEFLASILNDIDSQVMDITMDQGSTTSDNSTPSVGYHQAIPHPPNCTCAITNGTTSTTAPPSLQNPSAFEFEDHPPNNESVSLDNLKMKDFYDSVILRHDNISLVEREKLLRTLNLLNLPITQEDIIHLPLPELRQRLYQYGLPKNEILVLGAIRRQGHNRMYAKNCRRRRCNHIRQLKSDIQKLRDAKDKLVTEQKDLLLKRNNIQGKLSQLYYTVFQALRDEEGNPYSPNEFDLQQAADGNIILVPKNSVSTANQHYHPVII